VRDWVVGGGLIVSDEGLLLVRNRRRNGSHDWSPPGGVIDEGETVLGGLTREVEEETGLRVIAWAGPVYEVRCHAPDLGWRLRVEVHLALEVEGSLQVDDPDGIVVDAAYVDLAGCDEHLAGCPRWVRDPLAEWLAERWAPEEARPFGFHVAGRDPTSIRVTRLEA
jgi:8-oxo-dGTP diphosphatase